MQRDQQAPLSVHTSWLPGVSFWVHHLAVYLWPLYETVAPPTYAVAAFQAAGQSPAGADQPIPDNSSGAASNSSTG